MADKLMYISNDNTQNYPFCRVKLVVETLEQSTNHNSLKSPKLLSQRIKKLYYKTLGTSAINSPLSPIFLAFNPYKQMSQNRFRIKTTGWGNSLKRWVDQ